MTDMKTLKIDRVVHEKIKKLAAKQNCTLGEVIGLLFEGYAEEPITFHIGSGHTFALEKAEYTNIRTEAKVVYKSNNLTELQDKVAIISLIQRAAANLSSYAAITDHINLQVVVKKVESNFFSSTDLVKKMQKELKKIQDLSQSLRKLEAGAKIERINLEKEFSK